MGPQGGAEMRTKQTSDIILFNMNSFFFLSPSSPEHVHLNTVKHETAEANVAIMDTRVEVGNCLVLICFTRTSCWVGGGDPIWAQRNINWAPTQRVTKDRKRGLMVTCLWCATEHITHKRLSCLRCTVRSPQESSTSLLLHLGSQSLRHKQVTGYGVC